MKSPNEFWLCLHDLGRAVRSEGQTGEEQMVNVLDTFRDMPALAQREVILDLSELLAFLPEVYGAVHDAVCGEWKS